MRCRALKWMRGVLIGASAVLLMGCGAGGAPVSGQADQDNSVQQPQEPGEAEEKAPEEVQGAEEKRNTKETRDAEETQAEVPEDGVYTVTFETDSSMFHLNESCEGRARLTVVDGAMTVHIPLVSKSIVSLFPGTAEEARAADESEWLQPLTETVTYSDGYTEEVYAFDVPVPAVGEEFELALIGTKGKWYDHMVRVSDLEPAEGEAVSGEDGDAKAAGDKKAQPQAVLENGTYRVKVTLSGGTGRAKIDSPAKLTVSDEGMVARIVWDSPWYDYMVAEGVRYEPVNADGNSVFEIPVSALDVEIPVTADTVAMSTPHEIEYMLLFDSASAKISD